MSDEVHLKTSPFCFLPEGCIAHIISLTSPEDACRAAEVSLGFKSAADSDAVWERFLLSNCHEIVSRASSPLLFSTKKQLYILLLQSMRLLDEGKLSVQLNRFGKKAYMLSARALQIASVDNPQHWEWTSLPESRIIRGIIPARMLSPNTKYVAWLMYMPDPMFYGLDYPSKASVKFVKEDGTEMVGETTKVYIALPLDYFADGQSPLDIDGQLSRPLADGWYGIELVEFFIGEGACFDVHIQVSETECIVPKRGLILDGIELEPRDEDDTVFSKLSVLRDRS